MPFKSEAQRRYLWANEPEIARDWTNTYGSRVYKNTGGISQLVKSSGDGKRPGYGGPQDWGQQERAEKDIASGKSHAGSEGTGGYAGKSAAEMRSLSHASPSHGGMHTDWSKDPSYRDTGFRGPPVVDQKAIDEAKEVDWTKQNTKNAWQKGPQTFLNNWRRKSIDKFVKRNKYKNLIRAGVYKNFPGLYGKMIGYMNPPDEVDDFDIDSIREIAATTPGSLSKIQSQALAGLRRDFEFEKMYENKDPTQKEFDDYYGLNKPPDTRGDGGGYMGYPSYEAWLAAQRQGGGGGGDTPEEDTDWRTTQWNFDTTYPYPQYGLRGGGRVPRAFGGIMDTNTGRRAYGLGSIFKSVGKAVSGVAKAAGKVLKSDLGKAAMMYTAGTYLGGMSAFGGSGGSFMSRLASPGNIMNLLKPSGWSQGNILNSLVRSKADGVYGNINPWKAIGVGSMILPFIPGLNKAPGNEDIGMGERGGRLIDPITGKESTPREMRTTLNTAIEEAGTDTTKLAAIKDAYPYLNLGQYFPYQTYGVKDGGRIGFSGGGSYDEALTTAFKMYKEQGGTMSIEQFADAWVRNQTSRAQGGRIGAQEGGLMDLGGMEKDYRNNGGFVPIGGEERADDVPARLSRNEFVFTADAVRGAGGGDIDKGAEIMENVMKNLEQGGKISEETQGNAGAKEMFGVSERIGEVI